MEVPPPRRLVVAVLFGTVGVFLLNLGYMNVPDAIISAVEFGVLMALFFALIVVWRRRRARQAQEHQTP